MATSIRARVDGQEIRLAGKDRYTSVFESYVETSKDVQTVGRILTLETATELSRLRKESPKSTGLLAKSWHGYTLAKKDKPPPPKGLAVKYKKPVEKINLDDVYPEWFDSYYATKYGNRKLDKAIENIALILLAAAFIPIAPLALLYWFYKRFPIIKVLGRKVLMKLCSRVTATKKLLLKEPPPINRIRLYIRLYNTAPNSYYRIVGRAAGKMPPAKKLEQWAKRKGFPKGTGFVIAKVIAKRGTERYRSGQNVVGIDPTSRTFRGDSGFVQLVGRVLDRM